MTEALIRLRERALQRLTGEVAETTLDVSRRGVVREVRGITIVAALPQARIGDLCVLRPPTGDERLGEIVAIDGGTAIITCFSDLRGICNLTQVVTLHRPMEVAAGRNLIGRVVDAFGRPVSSARLETAGPGVRRVPVMAEAPPPLSRQLIAERYETGVRVIDTMLATGRGQRIGIFGGAGMGKSTLMSMLINNSACDVAVVGLVGERAREVREFWDKGLSARARDKTVVVASTSDRPAVERRLAGLTATAIAEAFSDDGLNVLLIVDSLTRVARAQREIGLAAGEPPSRRGFPPSTAGFLAELVERSGPRAHGTITAFYTVLVEGAFEEDPIAEELKALLDGHIVLSPKLSEAGHFPAIDVLTSRSRLHGEIAAPDHRRASEHIRKLLAKYQDVELLLQVGEYDAGSDPVADEAIAKRDEIMRFLQQPHTAHVAADDGVAELLALAGVWDDT